MGLFKRLGLSGRQAALSQVDDEPTQENPQRKKSSIVLVPLSEVTEASLKVFRQLPGTIRHDPSMISFQQEHERWKGEYDEVGCFFQPTKHNMPTAKKLLLSSD